MRILVLNWKDLTHPKAGGAEVYTAEITEHSAHDGHEVTLFCAAVGGEPADEVICGVRIVRRGGPFGVAARRWYAEDGRGRFDVVIDEVTTRPFRTPRWLVDTPVVALIHQVGRERPTILFVGRLTGSNRPAGALKAFRHVRPRLPTAELWIVGDGPQRRRLERRHVPGAIFWGRVEDHRKYELMAGAHVMVVTSVCGGLGACGGRSCRHGSPRLRLGRTRPTGLHSCSGRDSLAAAGPASLGDCPLAVLHPPDLSQTLPPRSGGALSWPDVTHDCPRKIRGVIMAEASGVRGRSLS